MRVEGMHPWWDEEEEKRRAAAMKTREPEPTVNENSFYAGAVKGGIMGTLGNKKFETIKDYEKAIGETEKTIIDLSHQQYKHMMNGDQPKMDALTPMIGQALMARDQLRVEMGNQMGLGSDGWASQNPNMLEQQVYGTEPLSTDIDRFTPEQQSKKDVLLGEHMPVNPNHLTPEQRSKADVLVGENAMAGQYVPSKVTPSGVLTPEEQSKRRVIVGEDAGAAQYIDDMTQTFGGMSEGLEAAQTNTRESILNSLSPELRSKADVYVGEANSIEEKENITSEEGKDENTNIFDTISDVTSGKWITDVVTGGLKWVKDNREGIVEFAEKAEAEKERILNTPIGDLTPDELETREEIELRAIEDMLDEQRDAEYAKLQEDWEILLQKTVSEYTNDAHVQVLAARSYGAHTAEEYEKVLQAAWEEKTKRELDQKYDSKLENEEGLLTKAYETAQEIEGRKNEGECFEIINLSGDAIDHDKIDNAILMGFNESGSEGQVLKSRYDDGKDTIQVRSHKEMYLTKEEAQNLYIAEHEGAKKLVSFANSAISIRNWKDALVFIAGELIDANIAEDAAMNTIKGLSDMDDVEKLVDTLYENPLIDITDKAIDGIKGSILGFIQKESINAFMDIMSSIHWDIDDIKGGNYIDIEVAHQLSESIGNTSTIVQNIRLYEVDGVYVRDPKNALNRVLNDRY